MSSETPPQEVTRLLQGAEQPGSGELLLDLVYGQLRKIAQQRMAEECQETSALAGRAHFFAAAAEAMRRIVGALTGDGDEA